MKLILEGDTDRLPSFLRYIPDEDFLDDDSMILLVAENSAKITISTGGKILAEKEFSLTPDTEEKIFSTIYDFFDRYRSAKHSEIELENHRKTLDIFLNISELVARFTDISSVLSVLMEYSVNLVNGEVGNIFLLESDQYSIEWGFPLSAYKAITIDTVSVVDQIQATGDALVMNDIDYPELTKLRIKTLISVPINFQQKILGIVTIINKRTDEFFTPTDQELLKSVCMVAAVSLERVKVFQENLERDRMMLELKVAHDVQQTLMPDRNPSLEGLDIFADCITALEIGGDLYYYEKSGDFLHFLVGDVSNKGVPAGLMMASTLSYIKVFTQLYSSTNEIVDKTNQMLAHDVGDNDSMFVTLFFGKLDIPNRILYYTNAGHNYPAIISEDGSITELIGGGPFIGQFPWAVYEERVVHIKKNDLMFFYTDGIIEGLTRNGELYGKDRLYSLLRSIRSEELEEIYKKVMLDLSQRCDLKSRWDDMTVMLMRFRDA